MNTYDLGDRVRIKAVFSDPDGVAADPTTVTVTVRCRDFDASDSFTGNEIARDSLGHYHVDFDPAKRGTWDYRVAGEGDVVAASEGTFLIRQSRFV